MTKSQYKGNGAREALMDVLDDTGVHRDWADLMLASLWIKGFYLAPLPVKPTKK